MFVILDNYADWESAFLAPALNTGVRFGGETTKYVSKTVAQIGRASCRERV